MKPLSPAALSGESDTGPAVLEFRAIMAI